MCAALHSRTTGGTALVIPYLNMYNRIAGMFKSKRKNKVFDEPKVHFIGPSCQEGGIN